MGVFNSLRRKKKYSGNQTFKLLIIDDESGELTVSLGITQERVDEIVDICKKSYKDANKLTEAVEATLLKMNHINEATYAILMLGRLHEREDSNPFLSFLKNL
jgi:hypothetical protein